jgi:hypothetical protein
MKNESVAVELPSVPEGGADGPDESWLPVGAAGEGGVGEDGEDGAGAGASPRAEQPLPKKPARQPMQREIIVFKQVLTRVPAGRGCSQLLTQGSAARSRRLA